MGKRINRPLLVVRNVLLTDNCEVLLGLRNDSLLWEFPGGKVDEEHTLTAAKREQYEETGMVLKGDGQLVGYADTSHLAKPERLCVEMFFLWREWMGFPQKVDDVHLALRWFHVFELPDVEKLMPGTRHIVERVLPLLLTEQPHAEGPNDAA